MGYSMRYLLQRQARGKPLPVGRPEDHLFQALERMSPMEIGQAFHMGAQTGARDGRGRTGPEVLLDALQRRPDLARATACLNELARHGTGWTGPADTTRRLLERAAQALQGGGHSQVGWLEAWRHLVRDPRAWQTPGVDGTCPLDHWKAQAGAVLAPRLASMGPRPSPPRP